MIFSGLYAGDRSLIYHYLKGAFFRSLVLKPYKLDISPINSSSMSTLFSWNCTSTEDFFFGGFSLCTLRNSLIRQGIPHDFSGCVSWDDKQLQETIQKSWDMYQKLSMVASPYIYLYDLYLHMYIIYIYTVYIHIIVTAVRLRNRFNLPIWGLESTFLYGFL